MSIYFSKGTKGFYHVGANIPADSVEVTLEQQMELLAAEDAGKIIDADADGNPIAIDPPFDFAVARRNKQRDIRTAFAAAEVLPVKALSINWHGGYESANKLDGARRLAELAGQSTARFFDTDNNGHDLSLADAATVVMTVGADYQSKFAEKQALMQAVAALDPTTATHADLDAIVVDFS